MTITSYEDETRKIDTRIGSESALMSASRPNILWYCTDQQRFDTIRALGNPHIATTNLDRMKNRGVAFRQAYAQSPVCTPSRASFLTGRYPSSTHVHRNGCSHFPQSETLVTKLLADAGYDCGLVGKLHLASAAGGMEPRVDDGYRLFEWSHHPMPGADSDDNAYHQWLLNEKNINPKQLYASVSGFCCAGVPAEVHQTTWATELALRFIDQKRSQPWLLSINVFDPHPPFDPPRSHLDRYDASTLPPPLFRETDLERQNAFRHVSQQSTVAVDPNGSNPEILHDVAQADTAMIPPTNFDGRQVKAAYYAMIELIDEQFGRIVEHLESTGQLENTLIVFHSDHGELLGDHGLLYKGCRFFEGLVHVPLMFMWKGRFVEDLESDALVELVDIAPTLLEAAGCEVPDSMQGQSLMGILTGQKQPDYHKSIVVSEFNDALGSAKEYQPTHATMSFDGRIKVIVYHDLNLGEIFDLEKDPGEFSNLWDSPELADVKPELLVRHMDAVMATSWAGIERVGRF
jgi:arylsulfatase A-like enzyme